MIRHRGAEYLKRVPRMRDDRQQEPMTITDKPTLFLLADQGECEINRSWQCAGEDAVLKVRMNGREFCEIRISLADFAAILIGNSTKPASVLTWREPRVNETIPHGVRRMAPAEKAEPAQRADLVHLRGTPPPAPGTPPVATGTTAITEEEAEADDDSVARLISNAINEARQSAESPEEDDDEDDIFGEWPPPSSFMFGG